MSTVGVVGRHNKTSDCDPLASHFLAKVNVEPNQTSTIVVSDQQRLMCNCWGGHRQMTLSCCYSRAVKLENT